MHRLSTLYKRGMFSQLTLDIKLDFSILEVGDNGPNIITPSRNTIFWRIPDTYES